MRFRGIIDAILSVGRTSAPILLLLVTAALYSRTLAPPFGLLVYTVKAAIPEETDVSIAQIFKSSTPYWIVMLFGMVAIVVFPKIATLLPELMF